MANGNNNEKNYSTWMTMPVGGKTVIYAEGFVRTNRDGSVLIERDAFFQGEHIPVASLNISVNLGDRTAEKLIGYVDTQYGGSYFVRVSAFRHTAERLRKYNPEPRQKMGFFGTLSVTEYNGKKRLEIAASDFKVVTGKKRPDTAEGPGNAGTAAAKQPEPADAYEAGFSPLPFGDDYLPFD